MYFDILVCVLMTRANLHKYVQSRINQQQWLANSLYITDTTQIAIMAEAVKDWTATQ